MSSTPLINRIGVGGGGPRSSLSDAVSSLMSFQIGILVLYGLFTTYSVSNPEGVGAKYGMMLDVSVMIFVGFGYLMTFLKKCVPTICVRRLSHCPSVCMATSRLFSMLDRHLPGARLVATSPHDLANSGQMVVNELLLCLVEY
jgi:hypothetical protein